MSSKIAQISIVAAFVLILTGCPLTAREQRALDDLANAGVIINYTLVSRCALVTFPNGPNGPAGSEGGPNHIFLVYTIDSIQNAGTRAEDYTFSPERLFVPTDLGNSVYRGSNPGTTHNTLPVPANTTQTNVGWIIMQYTTSNPAEALNSAPRTQLSLRYDQQRGEQPVLIVPSARREPIQSFQRCNPTVLPAGRRFE
ncbi:MAG TPA: hypothetical protein VGC87_24245 [Pyrinomonadaceae bacterium]|jgi:hypothetical protein